MISMSHQMCVCDKNNASNNIDMIMVWWGKLREECSIIITIIIIKLATVNECSWSWLFFTFNKIIITSSAACSNQLHTINCIALHWISNLAISDGNEHRLAICAIYLSVRSAHHRRTLIIINMIEYAFYVFVNSLENSLNWLVLVQNDSVFIRLTCFLICCSAMLFICCFSSFVRLNDIRNRKFVDFR